MSNDIVICTKHPDCTRNKESRCTCLVDNDFGTKDCPFYKSRDAPQQQKRRTSYHSPKTAGRVFRYYAPYELETI